MAGMLSRIPALLKMIAATAVALVVTYYGFLYSAALEADATQDRRTGILLKGEVLSHAADVRSKVEALAVSTPLFEAIQKGNSEAINKLLCRPLTPGVATCFIGSDDR